MHIARKREREKERERERERVHILVSRFYLFSAITEDKINYAVRN
jgi:hypothetical protein